MAEDTPSLLELARGKVRGKGPQCTILTLLNAHPDRLTEISELLDNTGELPDGRKRGEGLPYSVAADALTTVAGHKILGDTVSRHLRGRCGCS